MENSGGISASLQGRYASALYELAAEKKAVKAVDSEASVKIDLANIAVEIESAKPVARFAEAIEAAGYTPLLRP